MTPRIWPGALCVVVGMPEPLRGLNDRFVKLADQPAVFADGEWTWRLAAPVDVCLLCNARQGGRNYYIGETVVVESLQERFLRPITPPFGTEITDTDVPAEVAWG